MKNEQVTCLLGGEGRFGLFLSSLLMEGGHRVLSVDRRPNPARDSRTQFMSCDLAAFSPEDILSLKTKECAFEVSHFISLVRPRSHGSINQDEMNRAYEASVVGPYLFMNAAKLNGLADRVQAVVYVTSVLANSISLSQDMTYHTIKAAQEALTRYHAVAWGKWGVPVNAVRPGYIDYESMRLKPRFRSPRPESFSDKALDASHALTDLPTPSDVARVIVFLLGARGITGQTISVDGGSGLLEPLWVSSKLN